MRRLLLLTLLVLSSCRSFEPAKTADRALVELDPSEYPDFSDDLGFDGIDSAIGQSLTYFARVARTDPSRTLGYGAERVPAAKVVETLEKLRALAATRPAPAALNAAIRRDFRVFQSTGGNRDREVLFTGYYLPELNGSLTRIGPYTQPLYAAPKDMVVARARDFPQLDSDLVGRVVDGVFKPYPTRAEIGAGALEGRGLELLWVDSAVDAFFLEIQGSGLVKLPDGSTKVVTYAAKNGHKYVAIGAELIRRGALTREQVSMQAIRAWLEAHPDEQTGLLYANPSYVFFREGPHALGSLNVPVTPGRSVAADTRVFPKGAPCFIATERPVDERSEAFQKFGRFMLDQDTGGAIRTAARIDVFWGSGAYAANAAGRMKQQGKLYYLLAR